MIEDNEVVEVPVVVVDHEGFASKPRTLEITARVGDWVSVFPVGFKYQCEPGRHVIQMRSDGKGNVVFRFDDREESEPMLGLFCLVDGIVTLEGKVEVLSARLTEADSTEVEGGTRVFPVGAGTAGVAAVIDVVEGRAAAKMKVHEDCQVNFDFYQEGEDKSQFGVTMVHDLSSGHCNVYFDRHHAGVWLPDSRVKLGYFQLKAGWSYTVFFAGVPEEIKSDEWQNTLRASVSVDGSVKVMRSQGRFSSARITKVVARNSSVGRAGAYEVTSLKV